MTFKDLKPDYSIYLLDRGKLEYSEEKVASVGVPRFENKVGSQPRMVVDITCDVGGKPMTYPFTDNATKAYVGDLMVTTDKADIIAELKAIKTASERALGQVEKHKDAVARCARMLGELDTEYKEKQMTEERFGKLESGLDELKTMLSKLIN